MSNAALLIDWDNICSALGIESLQCHLRELPRLLVDQARLWASEHEAELSHEIVFVPKANVDSYLQEDFRAAGIELVATSAANQAADVHIFLRAAELRVEDAVEHFIVVSEDKGFIALAEGLESRSCRCVIWAFPSSRATDALRRYAGLERLGEKLTLAPCADNSDPTYQLLACLAALALDKRNFLGFAKGHELVARLEVPQLTSYTDISAAWQIAENTGYFTKDNERRIAFDARDVRRLFTLYDELLFELNKQRRRRDNAIVDADTLLENFEHPQLGEIMPRSLIRQLVLAGILTEADNGDLAFRVESTRLGLVGSLRRLAATAWMIQEEGRQPSRLELGWRWPSHARKYAGGPAADRRPLIDEGKHLVDIAKAHGLMRKVLGTRRLELNEEHPIALDAKRGVETVVRLLLAHGGSTEYRSFREELASLPLTASGFPPLGQTSNEREEWLGLAVACGHTQQKARENFVRLRDNSELVARMRAEAES